VKLSEEIGADFSAISEGKANKAAVFVAANTGLYGDIVAKTFYLFLDFLKKESADAFVVGRIGRDMMERNALGMRYEVLEMPDDFIDQGKFDLLAKQIVGYREIYVFYPKFHSLVYQEAVGMKISGDMLSVYQKAIDQKKTVEKMLKYLYEPSVLAVSKFFGEEIMMSSVEQMFRESQLARFAARLMHLDQAVNDLNKKIDMFTFEKHKTKKWMTEKRQRMVVNGLMARGVF
jgi:F0F1-type ATP synthase gamma subunit